MYEWECEHKNTHPAPGCGCIRCDDCGGLVWPCTGPIEPYTVPSEVGPLYDDKMITSTFGLAVESMLADLSDRRGFRQLWDEIDPEIQKEIRQTWKRIMQICLHETPPEEGHPSLAMRVAVLARKTLDKCPSNKY